MRLLRVLVQHAGKVLMRRFRPKELWDELTDALYLGVYVRQLREPMRCVRVRADETGIRYRLRAAG